MTRDAGDGQHRIEMLAVLAGHLWLCTCGEGGEPNPSERQAVLESERHIAATLGLEEPKPASEDGVYRMLAAIKNVGRRAEPSDFVALGDPSYVMDTLFELQKRDWVHIQNPMHGDNRLLAARGITLSSRGEQAFRDLMLRAIDIEATQEPDEDARPALKSVMPTVDDKRRARAEFMDRLYAETGGSTSHLVNARDLGRALGWEPNLTAGIVSYLDQQGLVTRPAWGAVSISHAGVVEVEELLAEPQAKTKHFNPINIVTVLGNNTGQIQAGTQHSMQNQVSPDSAAIERFLDELLTAARSAEAHSGLLPLAEAQVAMVREALANEGADAPLVRRLLPTLRDLAVNLTASGMFVGLVEAANQLPQLH
jgi:hypothetical protein